MGYWGVKSYDDDDADFALDKGFERVHDRRYLELMDDRNPLSYEQVQQKLADPETLLASLAFLAEEFAGSWESWDEEQRISAIGVIVRHAECGVPLPAEWRDRAVAWLEGEAVEWDEADAKAREARRREEIEILKQAKISEGGSSSS